MRSIRIAALAILAAALFSPRDAVTCGPFFPEYVYTPLHGPIDRPAFAHGSLGVVRPHFYREPLLIAYRYWSGVPLSPDEAAAVYPPAAPAGPSAPRPVEVWLAARARVPGVAKLDFINQDRPLPGKDQYNAFPNCLDDAFTSATATLADRQRRWGAGANLTEWLRGQDMVFQNCAGGETIPPELAGSTDRVLAADRRYQIAAAEFYATKFSDAARDFQAIAADAASPWHDSGAYLAARALIREGTLFKRPEKLREAQPRLAALRSNARWQRSARGLEDFIAATLDPKATLVKLGEEWTRPGLGAGARQVVTDYTHLWDRDGVEPPVAESELADWIVSFQNGGSPDHMVERWRAKNAVPWLVASIVWAKPDSPAAPDLIAAARKLDPASPAYPTATYYGIRLQIARGESDAAREWTDAALATAQPDAVGNLLRSERLRLARDWDEFLRYAVRRPVGETSFEGGEDANGPRPPDVVDLDFVSPMNRETPLALWSRAANAAALPREVQAGIAQAGWVRAVLLGDDAASREFAGRARDLTPALATAMRDYLAHPDRFTAAFWMLRVPGLSPEIRDGRGRTTELAKIDNFRDNWWYVATNPPAGRPDPAHVPLQDLYAGGPIGPTGFLPAADRAAGEAQWNRIAESASSGVNYLCGVAIAFAKAHPDDPRVPEALHLAVRATRYGPTDQASHAFSKEAFEILHRRYPATEWAKNTKYYY